MPEPVKSAPTRSADLTMYTASEIAERFRVGEMSSQEVVEAHIQRIEAINPRLNALVFPLFEQAREEARAADEATRQGNVTGTTPRGP